MSNNREKDLWEILDNYHLWMALLVIVILVVSYFGIGWMVPNEGSRWYMARQLLQDIIANLIPVILVFIILYAFFRHTQTLRSKRETGELSSEISSKVANMLQSELGFQTRGRLIIHSAKYGAEDCYNDVTQNLNSAISAAGRIEDLPIDNTYLGPDPIKRVSKKLTVEYFYAGRKRSITKDEGDKLSLP